MIVFMSPLEFPNTVQIPYLFYAAPHALFTLMALFLCINPFEYAVFVPLYIAGKGIALSAALGWLYTALPQVWDTVRVLGPWIVILPGAIVAIAVMDSLTILGSLALRHKLNAVTADGATNSALQSQKGNRL